MVIFYTFDMFSATVVWNIFMFTKANSSGSALFVIPREEQEVWSTLFKTIREQNCSFFFIFAHKYTTNKLV